MSVSALIRIVIEHSESTDPDVWVDEVVARIPDMEDAVRQLIRARISAEASTLRSRPVFTAQRGKFGSRKVQALHEEYWPKFLNQKIVGVDGYVRLGDATVADLKAAAQRNRVQAHALVVNAERLEAFACRMQQEGVDRFGDVTPLSEEELGR